MSLKIGTYSTCPACSAFNMRHRVACYKCGEPLPASTEIDLQEHAVIAPTGEIKAVDRRDARRHEVCLNGAVLGTEGVIAEVTIRNIGRGGLAFDGARPFNVNDRFTMQIELDGELYLSSAVIRYCNRLLSHETPFACGVEFVGPPSDLQAKIAELDVLDPEPWAR